MIALTNIKNYVGYASHNYPTYGVLKSSFFVFLYLCFIASIFSFVSKRFICFSILLSITVVYGVGLLLFQKKCKTPYFILRFFAKGTLGTMYSIVFLMLDLTLLESLGKVSLSYVLSLLIGYIILLVLFLSITVFRVKYNQYNNTKRKSKNSYFLIGFFSIAGIVFFRIISKGLSQEVVFNLIVILNFIIVAFGALGTTEYLKCYYLLRYPIVSEVEWSTGSEALFKTKRIKKKLSIFKKVFLFFSVLIIGIIILSCLRRLLVG